jgi:hypothetical protein
VRTEGEQSHAQDALWHLDEGLGELELRERPRGPDTYAVRLKARTATSRYRARRELYSLQHDGTQHEISGKAYILVPEITPTGGPFPEPQSSGAIGKVTDSKSQSMQHHDIASVRGLYYAEDRAVGIWEVDAWGRLDGSSHGRLWQLFESFMLQRFPQARWIFANGTEPSDSEEWNREFLRSLRYQRVIGTHRVFGKEVRL